jgi:hypothetical protein
MLFDEIVQRYLQEGKALPVKDDELGRNIKIIGRTELGRKIKDSDDFAIKDEPTFIPKKPKMITKQDPEVRDDAELFADVMEQAEKYPGLRVKMRAARINPDASRAAYIRAYQRADKIFDRDEGKRMSELKKLFFFIKKAMD